MARWSWILAVPVLMLCFPLVSAGQGFSFLQPWGIANIGNVQVSVSAQLGFQQMGVNINLPVPNSGLVGAALFTGSTLDFRLLDSGVWTGGISVEARRNGLSVFASAEGNAPKNARASAPSDPFYLSGQCEWRGSKLEWWALGAGGAFTVRRNLDVVGGFKVEHISLTLADPVDPWGTLRLFQATYGDRYSGDLRTKLWIPYFGIQIDGLNYRAKLLFSPVAWTDVEIPLRYLLVGSSAIGFEDAKYSFKPNGLWVEADLKYGMRILDGVGCNLWFKGSWLHVRGVGTEGYEYDVTVSGTPVFHYTESGSADGSLSSYVLAAGISGTLNF